MRHSGQQFATPTRATQARAKAVAADATDVHNAMLVAQAAGLMLALLLALLLISP